MSFFPSFSAIAQPKMRQEGFHLPSPSPSSGHPPSPPPGPFDIFLSNSSNHQQGTAQGNAQGSGGPNSGPSSNSAYPSLALPDAFSRTSAVDLTDELTMSLINSGNASNLSNERSTHTPSPHFSDPARGPLTPVAGTDSSQHHQHSHMHNIFDISAPPSSHFSLAGGHAFSLPHSNVRPDLPPLSQPASLATSHLFDHHSGHGQQHHDMHNFGLAAGRDSFPTHFNSTIPPLSLPRDDVHAGGDMNDPLAPFTPTSVSSMPARDSASPHPANGADNRKESRSRSRARTNSITSNAQPANSAGGPMRTTKSMSRRRDSFTLPPHLQSHSHSHHHTHSLNSHLNSLPSPPLPSAGSTGSGAGHAPRPSAIMIPDHSQGGGALSPLGSMGQLGGALSPLLAGQASGWFDVNGSYTTSNGVKGGIHGQGHDFGLPTPESVGSRHAGFNHFGTSVGSMSSMGMGISPKETVSKDPLAKDDTPLDPATKQAQLVSEKRRRRRESHNAVERRRRDNINEKISELATLIPEVLLNPNSGADKDKDKDDDGDGDAAATTHTGTAATAKTAKEKASAAEKSAAAAAAANAQDSSVKANKGMILRRSVDYIRYLQVLVGAQAARNTALERKLSQNGLSSSFADPGDELLLAVATAQLPLTDVFEIGEGMGISLDGTFGPTPAGMVMGAKEALQDAGLSTLEPMPMDEDMDMDMEFEASGLVNGFGHGLAKADLNGYRQSNESGSPDAQEGAAEAQAVTPTSDDASAAASSPRVLSSSQDLGIARDQSTDASVSDEWDPSQSSTSSSASEQKERGRRGRPPAAPSEGGSVGARVGRRRSKLVSVKEEGAGMEI